MSTVRERRRQETRYAITVLARAVLRVEDAAIEDLVAGLEAGIGEGPIFDRELWDRQQTELKHLSAVATATLDYRRRVDAIARGEEA
jgi:hypothetical protein